MIYQAHNHTVTPYPIICIHGKNARYFRIKELNLLYYKIGTEFCVKDIEALGAGFGKKVML